MTSLLNRTADLPGDEPASRGVLATIAALQSGTVAGRALAPADRRACVAYLLTEGYAVAEIARVLGVCDKTVARDRAELRREHALTRDPSMPAQIAGRVLLECEISVTRLRRIGRDPAASPSARVEAERGVIAVLGESVRVLQSLGFLPEAARRVRAEVTHRAEPPGFDELRAELARLSDLAGGDAASEFRRLELDLRRLEFAERLETALTGPTEHHAGPPAAPAANAPGDPVRHGDEA